MIQRIVVLFFFLILTASIASAQVSAKPQTQTTDERQVLEALLTEIRQLRVALQKASLTSQQIQIALERVRLQMSRVDSLRRELESTRVQLLGAKNLHEQINDQIKDVEGQITQETDSFKRTQFERHLKNLKRLSGTQAQREEQLREREVQLSAQLITEDAKLNELNSNLDTLERALTNQ